MEKLFLSTKYSILNFLVILFPFFFLTTTQEFFITNKFYFLAFGLLILLSVSALEILVTKKFGWEAKSLDLPVVLLTVSLSLSVIFSSPNKIQALLNPSFGLVMMVSLAILYLYFSRIAFVSSFVEGSFLISSLFLPVLAIIFFFQPFRNISLPQNLAFLKNPGFTPVGSQLDLAILLGFFVVFGIFRVIMEGQRDRNNRIFDYLSLMVNLVALFLAIFSLVKIAPIALPPFRLSWYAAVEILKDPKLAIIGIGLDNFSSIFTRVKDFAYNQSSLWQINSFAVSRSAVLQILTETGIFGLLAFGLLVLSVFRKIISCPLQPALYNLLFIYLLICLFIFPTSLVVWFLFFLVLSVIASGQRQSQDENKLDLSNLAPVYIGTVIIFLLLITGAGYFLGRAYAAEYYFNKSLDGYAKNNAKLVYDNQRKAIIVNPYIERFRSNFAQTNLLIANNLAQRKSDTITDQDKQMIAQAIQAGIAEGKAVVSLNPNKAEGWQNLALIYSNIINVAQGADVWTISAYQRAILADPQNPIYRVGLGGTYYSLEKYDDALKFFEQAISLKPDWANASYNYAWANFQKGNYDQAVNAMQNTSSLLDPKSNEADYEKVKNELEEFKKMLPKEEVATPENTTEPSTNPPPSSLNLPTPPATQISPKLELPKEASPEAS